MMKLRDILNNLILENSSYFDQLESNWKKFGNDVKIPLTYQIFQKKKKVPALKNKLCYLNSLMRAKSEKNTKLAIGLVVSKKPNSSGFIDFTKHAWNIVDGNVEDCTLGNDSGVYIGRIVKNTENLKDGSDVRDLLFNDLGIN